MDFMLEQVPTFLPTTQETEGEAAREVAHYFYRNSIDGRGACRDENKGHVVLCSEKYLTTLLEHLRVMKDIFKKNLAVASTVPFGGTQDAFERYYEERQAPESGDPSDEDGLVDQKILFPEVTSAEDLLHGLIAELRRLYQNPCLFADTRIRREFFTKVRKLIKRIRDVVYFNQEIDNELDGLKTCFENDIKILPVHKTENGIDGTSKTASWTPFVKSADRHGRVTTQKKLKEKLKSGKPEGGVWTAILSLPQGCVLVLERWIEQQDAITEMIESSSSSNVMVPAALKATYQNVYRASTDDGENQWMSGRSAIPPHPKIRSLPQMNTEDGETPAGLAAFLGQIGKSKQRGNPFRYEMLDLLQMVPENEVKSLLNEASEKEGRELIKELIKFN